MRSVHRLHNNNMLCKYCPLFDAYPIQPATYCNTFSFGMADRIRSEKIVIGFQEKEEEENEKLDFCIAKNVL